MENHEKLSILQAISPLVIEIGEHVLMISVSSLGDAAVRERVETKVEDEQAALVASHPLTKRRDMLQANRARGTGHWPGDGTFTW